MAETISAEEYRKQPKKESKLKNKITVYNGVKYSSIKEAEYAKKLDWAKKYNQIKDWKRQVSYKLIVNDVLITTYVLDFLIENNDGSLRHPDVKGRKAGGAYELFKIKKRLMKAIYNIDVEEV